MAPLHMPGSNWYPVAPAHFLRASDNIIAAFTKGQELAIWRSKDGVVQVWENRCPHRGTRLTLGRIIDGRLSCAYHGWEFSADGGKCAAIPAHPSTPAPKQLCVKTFMATEAAGMVWVGYGQAAVHPPASGAEPTNADATFVRTLGIRTSLEIMVGELAKQGFRSMSPFAWQGQLSSLGITVFLTEAAESLTFAHVWLEDADTTTASQQIAFAASSRLREGIEAAMSSRS